MSTAPRPGSARPGEFAVPEYGGRSLAELLPACGSALGVSGLVDTLALQPFLAGVRRIAVLLIDGLGARNLAEHRDLAPTLRGMAQPCGELTAACPSTTPVSLATLCAGRPPGEHGIMGFTVALPGTDELLTHITWRDDPDPAIWQPVPTVFELAAAQGISTHSVGPGEFRGSGLTEAIMRGSRYRPAIGTGDLGAGILAALADGDRTLVYGYHSDLDRTGHVRGWRSPAWQHELGQVDRLVERIVAGLPADTALVVTADHGMVDVAEPDKLDLDAVDGAPGTEQAAELAAGVRVLAGEPRARYVHTEPGATEDVLATWRAVLGERAWVISRAEFLDAGLAGPIIDPAHAERIGDVAAFTRGRNALVASGREASASRLIGYHGSLTDAEVSVPLLISRGAG